MDLFDSIKDYIGPILGALAGSGLNFHFDKSGSSSRQSDINIENINNINGNGNSVSNINIIDKSKIAINYKSDKSGSDGGGVIALIAIGFMAIAGAIYGYSVHAPLILYYTDLAIKGAAAFAVFYGLTGGFRGTQGWGIHAAYTTFALLLLGIAYWYCLPKLYSGYSPTYADHARAWGVWGFYKNISEDVKNWIFSQIVGLSTLIAAVAFTIFYSISGNTRQRLFAFIFAAVLLFASGYGAEGHIHG